MISDVDQFLLQLHTLKMKFDKICSPWLVWVTSGWNCRPKIFESEFWNPAGFQNSDSNIFGLQFHPEVTHTNQGEQILSNFIFKVCSCSKNWSTSDIINSMVSDVKNKVKNEKVLLGP